MQKQVTGFSEKEIERSEERITKMWFQWKILNEDIYPDVLLVTFTNSSE